VSRLTPKNERLAAEIIARYPRPRSALIPLLHLAQEQDGYVAGDAMEHIAELVGATPAEVLGTCSFYEMFKRHPVGRYVVNICTNLSCQLLGAEDLLHHAERTLGVRAGGTTGDGLITLEDVECIAACTEAPCLQVNYRYEHRVTIERFDRLVDDLRAGRRPDIPAHGTLHQVRQHIPTERRGVIRPPEELTEAPAWFTSRTEEPA
jgi:NADH-quinone oxidoreductase subunit E